MMRTLGSWIRGTLAQRLTVLVAVATVVSVLGPTTRTERAQFDCRSDDTGLPVVIVYAASRTPSAIAKRYCTGDIAAVESYLEERYGNEPMMLGGIVRLPVDKP